MSDSTTLEQQLAELLDELESASKSLGGSETMELVGDKNWKPNIRKAEDQIAAARASLVSLFTELQAELASLRNTGEDAERFAWCAENYFGADFHYGDEDNPICALVIRIPEIARVSADLRDSIDRLRQISGSNPGSR